MQLMGQARRDLLIVSPYFVPGPEITAAFETTLAKIHERVSAFLALPLKTISAEQLKAELNRIGSL